MGNAAAISSEHFEKMRAEFEEKKGSLSDEELFNHMKAFYEGLQAAAAVSTESAVEVATSSPLEAAS